MITSMTIATISLPLTACHCQCLSC